MSFKDSHTRVSHLAVVIIVPLYPVPFYPEMHLQICSISVLEQNIDYYVPLSSVGLHILYSFVFVGGALRQRADNC